MAESNIAVLVDSENVDWQSVQRLLREIPGIGNILEKRAYSDWSVPASNKVQTQLIELGFQLVHQKHASIGKNSSDIALSIDAMDLLHRSSATIDTFIIVSSDSDFFPLVNKLRSSGKTVIVAGRSARTSDALINSCDRFIDLDTSTPAAPKEDEVSEPQPSEKPRSTTSDDQASAGPGKGLSPAKLLRLAMDASMDEEGSVTGSKLHDTMRRIEPRFDFKKLGHSTFTRFLESRPNVVKVTRPEGPGAVRVQLVQK